MKRIAITGIGAVSSAGENVSHFFEALTKPPELTFKKSSRIDLDIEIIVGEASDNCFTEPSSSLFDNPTSRLALTAATESVLDYQKQTGDQTPNALIVGTSTGGQKVCEDFLFSRLEGRSDNFINYRAQGIMASTARMIASELKIEGRVNTVSTACTSSANAIAMGCSLIETGRAKSVLAGGGDALCATTMSGFNILGLTGINPCTPFAPNRPGMSLGDGAAFLMLESLDQVLDEKRPYYGEVLGYGFSSDAYSMTSPSENGEGAIVAMKSALKMANLKPEDVSFVNAHGTGTLYNDRSEALAIQSLFPNTPTASLKGLTGHTLGGAGALEAIASLYVLQKKRIWENFNSPICGDDCPINLVPKGGIMLNDSPIVISNSFAFGGNNCSLIFGL